MADKAPPDPALVTDILVDAIRSAGPIDDPAKWRGQLTIMIPEIVAVLGEGSRERDQVVDMMTAPILMGDFVSAKLNDSNHRVLVTIQCHERDPEDFWSERTDTPLGAAQYKLLQTIRKGDRVRVWKGLRQIDQTKKVRDLLHIQRLSADPSRQPAAPPADTGPAAPSEDPGPAQSPPEPAPPSSGGQQIALDYKGALDRLSGANRVKLAKWANETMKVTSLYDEHLTADQKNTILAHCELIQGGMA